MIELGPKTTTANNAAAITRLFKHLIDSPAGEPPADDKLYEDAEDAWAANKTLQLVQGNISGTFRRESVAYLLGQLPGFTIQIALETDTGERSVRLQLNGSEPAFEIHPVPVT